MKKIILFILITIAFSSSIRAVEFDVVTNNELRTLGAYFGNPSENIIINSSGVYVIVHNPTPLAIIVMRYGARDFCRNEFKNESYDAITTLILGKYTAYFVCEMKNKFDHYSFSAEEEKCIEGTLNESLDKTCLIKNEKNIEIINKIESQIQYEDKFKNPDYIYSVRAEFYDNIAELETRAEMLRLKAISQRHINTCRNYNFMEPSEAFTQCILNLIEKSLRDTSLIR